MCAFDMAIFYHACKLQCNLLNASQFFRPKNDMTKFKNLNNSLIRVKL